MTTTVGYQTPAKYPRVGYALSLIGGLIIILQGLIATFFSSIYYAIVISFGVGLSILLIGIFLIILGIIVVASAYGLVRSPDQHVTAGAAIIVFSLIALVFGGGYLIGSVLGIIGGIFAIVWHP